MIESAGPYGNAKGGVGVTGTPICVGCTSQAVKPTTRLYSSFHEIGRPCAQSRIQERHHGRCTKN